MLKVKHMPKEQHPAALSTGTLLSRLYSVASGAVGAIAGITPHVLHHIGPIAGTALLTGTGGSVLFGAIGFVLTVPLLLKLKRRFNTWTAPGVALTFFAVMFTISTLWIGPWIRGDDSGGDPTAPADEHHTRIYSGETNSRIVFLPAQRFQSAGR